MKLTIKRIDQSLPLPKYQTKGSVAFDLYSRTNTTIPPHSTTILPANIIVRVPEGYFLMLSARSSLPKRGLMVANSIGIIDQDYCGDGDEIGIFIYNFSSQAVSVERGERIAQATLITITKASSFEEVSSMKKPSRGGFGSTGKK